MLLSHSEVSAEEAVGVTQCLREPLGKLPLSPMQHCMLQHRGHCYQVLQRARTSALQHTSLVPRATRQHLQTHDHSKLQQTRNVCRSISSRRQRLAVMAAAPASAPTAVDSSVAIFTTAGCPYCRAAKQSLRERGVAYAEVDVSTNTQLRAQLKEATGRSSVPQIYVGGQLVGGNDDLQAKLSDGSFDKLLQGVQAPALPADLAAAVQQSQRQQETEPGPVSEEPPQELQQIAQALGGFKRLTGAQLLDWLQSNCRPGSTLDRPAASKLAQRLIDANLVNVVSDTRPASFSVVDGQEVLYVARPWGSRPAEVEFGRALNTGYWWAGPARQADKVAEDLRQQILALYDKHLSSDGRAVSYKAMRDDPLLWRYMAATAELQQVDLSPLTRDQLMSMFINLYNALVIHALVVHCTEAHSSTFGRLAFFSKAAKYNIAGHEYSADDIENGVLRGNRPSAAAIGMLLGVPQLAKPTFKSPDPRAAKVVHPMDARIHFALVCGAKSCPPIKLYSADTLEEGLTAAAEAFCQGEVQVDEAAREVAMSKIFKWYYPDFGSNKAERLRFVLPYLGPQQRGALERLLAADPSARGIKIKYNEYDWSINAAEE